MVKNRLYVAAIGLGSPFPTKAEHNIRIRGPGEKLSPGDYPLDRGREELPSQVPLRREDPPHIIQELTGGTAAHEFTQGTEAFLIFHLGSPRRPLLLYHTFRRMKSSRSSAGAREQVHTSVMGREPAAGRFQKRRRTNG